MMDKICDICGDVGFPEEIRTCSQCKKASEHTYCMRNGLNLAQYTWCCELCRVVEGNVTYRLKTVESNSFQVKEIERHSPSFIQSINVGEKQIPGRKKLFCAQDKIHEVVDGSSRRQGSAAFAPSSEPALQALSRTTNSKTPETSKVKFLPTAEVTKLNSGIKAGESAIKFNSSGSLHQNDLPYPSRGISDLTSRAIVSSPPSNVTISSSGSLHRSGKGTIMASPIAGTSPSIPKSTGEEPFTGLCKERYTERFAGAEGCFSLKSKNSIGSKCDFDSTSMHVNDGQQQISVDYALALPKEEPRKSGVDPVIEESPATLIKQEKLTCSDFLLQHTRDREGKLGIKMCTEKPASQVCDMPQILLTDPNVMPPNRHIQNACWKGTFEVLDVVTHVYGGIQAYLPHEVSSKAYDIQKQMPENLKLNLLPRTNAWPRAFHSDPPTSGDIALYFLPCEDTRPREKYFRLMERIDLHDSVMQTWVGEVELIIFSSKQLPLECQRIGIEFYFWGIFRRVKLKKVGQCIGGLPSRSHASSTKQKRSRQLIVPLEDISEVVDMEIDMVGGSEIGRIDKPVKRLDAPPGFMRPHGMYSL